MANLCRRGHLKKSSKHAVCMKCYALDREKHLAMARALLIEKAKLRHAQEVAKHKEDMANGRQED